jgi:hypothetical protein
VPVTPIIRASAFGYESLEEAAANSTLSLYKNPDDRKALIDMLEQAGRVAAFEVECITRTGKSIFVLLCATLESGIITGIMRNIQSTSGRESPHCKPEKLDRGAAHRPRVQLGTGD